MDGSNLSPELDRTLVQTRPKSYGKLIKHLRKNLGTAGQVWMHCGLKMISLFPILTVYAGTSLSCAGIQRWKSVFVSLLSCNQFGWWDEQWGAGDPTPYPTHPFPSSLCEEFCMSDNMCISCLPAAVPAYWDPGGFGSFGIAFPPYPY